MKEIKWFNTKINHSNGTTMIYEYDDRGNITIQKELDADGKCIYEEVMKYDSNYNIIYFKNRDGVELSFIYDENNKLICSLRSDGDKQFYEYEYDEDCSTEIIKDKDGNVKLISKYDKNGNKIYCKNCCTPELLEIWAEYDENNNLINVYESSHPNRYSGIVYNYDNNGNCIYTKSSIGFEEWAEYEYDQYNNKISYKSTNGIYEIYKYDKNGNEIYYRDNSIEVWSEYDKNNNMIYSKSVETDNGDEYSATYEYISIEI